MGSRGTADEALEDSIGVDKLLARDQTERCRREPRGGRVCRGGGGRIQGLCRGYVDLEGLEVVKAHSTRPSQGFIIVCGRSNSAILR